jgi:hypothetical protein
MLDCYRWLKRKHPNKLGRMTQPREDGLALLRDAIRLSGLSTRSFAETVLVRDERTVRRWIAGEAPIPDVVTRFLNRYLAARTRGL